MKSEKRVQLLKNRSEIAAGTRGASLGPDAIKVAAWNKESDYFKKYPAIDVPDQNDLLNSPTDTPSAKRIQGILDVYRNTSDRVSKILGNNEFPLILSGDHASAGGTIAGIRKAYPDHKIGVIWVDAHADLHSPYTSPSGNVHGMPLATALGEDNKGQAVNQPEEKAAKLWEELKGLEGIRPKIEPGDIVFIGVRDTEKPEDAYIKEHAIPNLTVADVRDKGPQKIAEEALSLLADHDIIYVSFDVDSLDSAISHGTGTPVPDGLTEEEALEINRTLVADDRVKCYEMVEVNPTLDEKCNLMAENALTVLEQVTLTLEKR